MSARALSAGGPIFPFQPTFRSNPLTYTSRIQHSVFLNTMVFGTPKNQEEALGGLRPFNYIVDIPAGIADIPGDGRMPVSFTSTQDVGRFVAASLDLEHWEPVSGMAGDKKTYDEVVEIAERVTGGKKKVLRRYTSIEELRKKAEEDGVDRWLKFLYQVSACVKYEPS